MRRRMNGPLSIGFLSHQSSNGGLVAILQRSQKIDEHDDVLKAKHGPPPDRPWEGVTGRIHLGNRVGTAGKRGFPSCLGSHALLHILDKLLIISPALATTEGLMQVDLNKAKSR